MTASEKRLLAWFVLAAATAGTLLHWATKEAPPVVDPTPPAPVSIEADFLASVAGAGTVPAAASGAWRVTWRGAPAELWTHLRAAEKAPGGYFLTSVDLREADQTWQLELVAAPWREGLAAPTVPVDVATVPERLGWNPVPVRTPASSSVPKAPVPAVPAVPAGPVAVADALVLLGSYGGGAGMHWWLKEKATDRVFSVPGSDDWNLVQADGGALVLQRAGVLYRVELTP